MYLSKLFQVQKCICTFSQFVAEYWCDHLKRSRVEQKSQIVLWPGDPFNGLAMMMMMTMMMTMTTKRHI